MQSLISPVTKAILVALFIFAILLILYVILWNKTLTPNSFNLSLDVGGAVSSKDKYVTVLWNSITFIISQGFLLLLMASEARSAKEEGRAQQRRLGQAWKTLQTLLGTPMNAKFPSRIHKGFIDFNEILISIL
ncbi:hypothetical protein BTVI_52134 [Pitangus sulphuratus]|nr:hypothetical protein BTVI_52134 [Pitangus sulphuratus]